jgi:hypothetical protein
MPGILVLQHAPVVFEGGLHRVLPVSVNEKMMRNEITSVVKAMDQRRSTDVSRREKEKSAHPGGSSTAI